jgi:hypothetical protein
VTVNSTIGLVKALYKVTQDEKIRERASEIQSGVLKSFKIQIDALPEKPAKNALLSTTYKRLYIKITLNKSLLALATCPLPLPEPIYPRLLLPPQRNRTKV